MVTAHNSHADQAGSEAPQVPDLMDALIDSIMPFG